MSTYEKQFIVSNLDAIKLSAERFLLNAENYTDFAAQNPLIKLDAKIQIPASNYAVNLTHKIANIRKLQIMTTLLAN